MNVDYEWQRPYVAAVLETDGAKLAQRIAEAHAAINRRIIGLGQIELGQDHLATPQERKAIEAALHGLNLLRNEILDPKGTALSGCLDQ